MFVRSKERRKNLRFDFHSPLYYRRIRGGDWKFKGSFMKNISESGVMTTTYEFLSLKLGLVVKIPLLWGTESVKAVCQVAWMRKVAFGEKYDVGLKFLVVSQESSRQISRFILRHEKEQVA